jgi:hypothetical protein
MLKIRSLPMLAAALMLGTSVAHANICSMSTTSATNVCETIPGLSTSDNLTFSPSPAEAIKQVTNTTTNDMTTLFPDQSSGTLAAGIHTLFSLSSTPVLSLTGPTMYSSPLDVDVPGGYLFAAIHQDTSEIVFEYSTVQTNFQLSGFTSTLSNINFFSAVPAPLIGHGLFVLLGVGGVLFGSKLLESLKTRRSVTPHAAA